MSDRDPKPESAGRRLLVIDGANSIFRAFFAIPHLRAPDGSPTNAAYGFVNMLTKLLREENPDFVAVAYDARGGTFRHELYGDYKAGRDATPEDLAAQIPLVRELVAAHHIPLLEVPSFEADDIIATLVKQAPEDVHVLIVSSDKNLEGFVHAVRNTEARLGNDVHGAVEIRGVIGSRARDLPGDVR